VGNVCRVKLSHIDGKGFADVEEVETEVLNMLIQQSRTSMLRVSTHWQSDGTSVSILVVDMSRN
jgi:hypothetical protein